MKKFWLILALFPVLSVAFGQNPLNARVDISIQNQPLEAALYLLIDEAQVNLSFSNAILPKDKFVTLKAENQQVGEVLEQMLEGTELGYEVVGSQIVLLKVPPAQDKKFIVSGYVSDSETGERIVGAVIFDDLRSTGTYTNEFGFFSLAILSPSTRLIVSSLGYKPDSLSLRLFSNRTINVKLQPAFLAEVVVSAYTDSILLGTSVPNAYLLNIEGVSKLATLGGEADILRIAYTLPGIQTGADGFGGVAVRGGNIDQNLFLLDGVPVYNATHGAGIFSIYNTSAIRSAQLLKGNFPAQYGGRISSVWDIQTKEGNSNYFQGDLELGLSSGKLTLEGPVSDGKGSFFVSGRRAFFDFFSVPFTTRIRKDKGVDGYISYYFYDLNFKINYKISSKDRVYLSFYRGLDDFSDVYDQSKSYGDTLVFLADSEKVFWGNNIAALRWNHQYSEKLFGNTTLTFSEYFYESQDLVDYEAVLDSTRLLRDVLLLKYNSNIGDLTFKTDFDYSLSKRHRLRFGLNATKHKFQPGIISFDQATAIDTILIDTLGELNKNPFESFEFDGYVQDEVKLGRFVQANLGFRLSALSVPGKNYLSPQPRLLLHFFQGQKLSAHASIGRASQNLHQLSPTSIGLPKDLWVSATANIPTQHSWQYVAGIQRQLRDNVELSLDGYYKTMSNLLIFKGTLLDDVNATNWQNNVSLGKGQAYGAELLLKKQGGRLNGWFGYTLAWTERQFDKEINKGEKFPFRLDHRHSIDLQVLYKRNEKWEFAAGFKYGSGSAFTFPTQQYEFAQASGHLPTEIVQTPGVVDELNGQRLPPYHRLDLSANYSFWQRKTRHTLIMGIYNAYNRKNPLYITIRDKFGEDEKIKRETVQVSLLPIFPTLRYLLEFR